MGVFYGVGVGPGDPELMTLKALTVLKAAQVIAVPRSSEPRSEGSSQALAIVKKALDLGDKDVLDLVFPMVKDKDALRRARELAASRVVERLKSGLDVAFITLGDPMLYSTFGYLAPIVKDRAPGAAVRVVPGITSFSAAASAVATPLAEASEKIIILPAAYDITEIEENLKRPFDTVVLMKVNRIFDRLLDLLCSMGLEDKAFFVARVGWPEEEIVTDLKGLRGRDLDYFSTVIVKKGARE
ncbi:MAG: precorrin-2 C(20)-methyltransferase [Deltaproteobacteria bacterium]|nr:precorrin-2 C(20)-methyltransferase [Deltaproteobacteria bacterium]